MSLDYLKPKEKFLILEISKKGTDGIYLDIDEDRNLIFRKIEENIDVKNFLKSSVLGLSQKSFEGHYLLKSKRKIIAGADSSIATTISIPINNIEREDFLKKRPMSLVEFENLFSQIMASIVSKCKNEAAEKLNIKSFDTILVSAKVNHFKIGSELVENPISLIGDELSFIIDLTFTTREIFEEFKILFSAPEEFLFVESPSASLHALTKVKKMPLALLVLGDDDSRIYILSKGTNKNEILLRERFNWSFLMVFEAIQRDFSVGIETSKELYKAYSKNEMSKVALKVFKKTVDPIFDLFIKELNNKKIKEFVYIDSKYNLPYKFPFKNGKIIVSDMPISDILSDVDFSINIKDINSTGLIFGHLAPFFDAFFNKDTILNRKIRKKLHWLAE